MSDGRLKCIGLLAFDERGDKILSSLLITLLGASDRWPEAADRWARDTVADVLVLTDATSPSTYDL